METPTINKKQAKKTLSGRKKKAEVIKNVLAKPYQNYWPHLTQEDNNLLIDTLKKFLPRVAAVKTSVPYREIKNIPREERKAFRKSLVDQGAPDKPETEIRSLCFGVNDVARLIENEDAGSVMVSNDVQPRLLVQHVLDQAVLHKTPILVVENLKAVCKEKCGIRSVVLGLRKSILPDSELGVIQQTICNLYENYPVPDDHINSHRKLDVTTITIPDTVDDESVCVLSDSDDDCTEAKQLHLAREGGKKRAFVPEKSMGSNVVAFINLDSNSVLNDSVKKRKADDHLQYQSLKVKRVKGDKARNKRKMERFKKK